MEANFFRSLAGELAQALTGLRIEKVHGPAEDTLVLALHGRGRSERLIFRPAKTAGLLFLSVERPANPASAPARVMWLRKRLTGRRLMEARCDWPALRLAFSMTPRDEPRAGRWLVFDLRAGLELAEDFPLPAEPAWPDLPHTLDDPEIWRACPQITPPLRRRLSALAAQAPDLAEALRARLASGRAGGFFLPPESQPLAWDEGLEGTLRLDSALVAARLYGERTLFPLLARIDVAETEAQAAQARKRAARRQTLLDQDEERHTRLAELHTAAEALQANLSSLKGATPATTITLPHPVQGPVDVPLDPRLTPAENMARLFRQAAKGRRGLEHVTRLRAGLSAEAQTPLRGVAGVAGPVANSAAPALPKRYQGLAVACFRTSDGFLALRGKSSQANHDMLSRAAAPYDLWFHVAGGPGSHVILRRDHPGQEVPQTSLLEAAGLCALRSYRKDDAKAEVLCALVRDVRKIKGAALGSVAVDQVERTLVVALDPDLESRLAVAPLAPE